MYQEEDGVSVGVVGAVNTDCTIATIAAIKSILIRAKP
jgi:hypothetical protein